MSAGPREPFQIGDWTVFPELNRITNGDSTVSVEGKVMAVLLALARNAGDVMSKDALLDSVWRNQVVADGVLTRAIHELRQALQDDANAPRYIETVPRRGYRLRCPDPGDRLTKSEPLSGLVAGLSGRPTFCRYYSQLHYLQGNQELRLVVPAQ